ncbi:VanZ family protein [Motilimonas cestriensis]|uniref:VanZ family protein n=1 Tax=Motilimonas cestriensis TaxID=2742685 RepID=A0ABS8W7Y8_9GAMM|nr:VanZ family protein [Motilimonas cestriensis]MCE2594222.1 VanZ family protein [Motilimonas cestriensis]
MEPTPNPAYPQSKTPLWPLVRYQVMHLLPLFVAFIALLFFLPYLPLGKNLNELISQSNIIGLSLALVIALYLIFVFPISLLRASVSIGRILSYLLISHGLLWLILSSQVAAESLFDILGNPIYQWPWETELMMRFFAWLWLIQLSWLLATLNNPLKWLWLALCPFIYSFSYLVIITFAATDNITELLHQPFGLVGITSALLVLFLSADLLSQPNHLGRRVLIYLFTWLVSFGLIWLSTASQIEKYGSQYSALSFMLGFDRQQSVSMALITLLSLLPYIVLMTGLVQLRKLSVHNIDYSADVSTAASSRLVHISTWPLVLYAILITYGTLYPFSHWQSITMPSLFSVFSSQPSGLSSTDILVNSIIYLPFGFMLHQHFYGATAKRHLWVLLWAFLLSYSLEYLQHFLPERNTSQLDLLLNTLGGGLGSLIAARYHPDSDYLDKINRFYQRYIIDSPSSLLGILSLVCMLVGYFSPLQPNLSPFGVLQSIKPLFAPQLYDFSVFKLVSFFLQHLIMGLLLRAILLEHKRWLAWLLPLALTLLHPFILYHSLSLDLVLGSISASFILLLACQQQQTSQRQYSVVAGIILAWLLIKALMPSTGEIQAFNWVPFFYQLQNLAFATTMFNVVWPVLALAFCAMQHHADWFVKRELICALAVALFFIALEALQVGQPGRYPDITDAIIASISWIFIVHFWRNRYTRQEHQQQLRVPYWPITVFSLCLLLIGAILSIHQFSQPPAPLQASANNYQFKGKTFNALRPRLPAPTAKEMVTLKNDGQYLRSLTILSQRGKLESQVQLAYLAPELVDLAQLHQSLMALEFSGRGNVQVKPLALAYDWLYSRWSEQQLTELKGKLLAGCQFTQSYIVTEQLSPYNVYLYNSPLQALMACAIAGYQESPEFDAVMSFTAYTWLEQVLPVWRQVMGQHGGWHEGAEYVGIGIGQAIYQLPAMWRKATGEDYFNEPSIRGFADFLLYRIRPDGSQIRWGDGRFFDRGVPDQLALALELDHQASLVRISHKHLAPTSWPWGPLAGEMTPAAQPAPIPWAKWFDGIGHLIARSSEDEQATLVNFRAGDNYWSHQHLDQGSFTLYKGSPLAIDSGFYGPGYGADHHLNYSYQTIAHNTLTVTDPADNQPMPAKRSGQADRDIANDGGQRRIGSGWGSAAPVSLKQWQQQQDTYHTAKVLERLQTDDFVLVYADLTPAYTNSASGRGEFSARTRRVEAIKRLFIYDKFLDSVIVYDAVQASDSAFTKRWLLHTNQAPRQQSNGDWLVPSHPQYKHQQDANLRVSPLLPQKSYVLTLGGPGFDFYIDGKNYDEAGKINTIINKQRQPKPEPGQWRLEIIPEQQQLNDEFLVVLKPELTNQPNTTVHTFSTERDQHQLNLSRANYQLSITITAQQIALKQRQAQQEKIWNIKK